MWWIKVVSFNFVWCWFFIKFGKCIYEIGNYYGIEYCDICCGIFGDGVFGKYVVFDVMG